MFINIRALEEMKIAFVGDVHGRINHMYELVSQTVRAFDYNVRAILQVGDFHAIRNEEDLKHFPVPEKHRVLGDFPSYFQIGS